MTCYVQVVFVMSILIIMQPTHVVNLWNEALGKRLGTDVYQKGLSRVLAYISFNVMFQVFFL